MIPKWKGRRHAQRIRRNGRHGLHPRLLSRRHDTHALDPEEVDAWTSATFEDINTEIVAHRIRANLVSRGHDVIVMNAVDVYEPGVFIEHDAVILGTAAWFSMMTTPMKRLFDDPLTRIYDHRDGRLNDKIVSIFATCRTPEKNGLVCLETATLGMEHLCEHVVERAIINVLGDAETMEAVADRFCERFHEALTEQQIVLNRTSCRNAKKIVFREFHAMTILGLGFIEGSKKG